MALALIVVNGVITTLRLLFAIQAKGKRKVVLWPQLETTRLKQSTEKVESVTSAAKAADENKILTAALKSCATQNQTLSPACEAPRNPEADSFRRP